MFETISWDMWLGIGSGALLVIGLVLAAARRGEVDAYRQGPRRQEPMPLYQNARNRDSLAEWAIVALVVIVLGIAASRTDLDPSSHVPSATVDRLAAQVRMTSPIARDCLRDRDGACRQIASNGRP